MYLYIIKDCFTNQYPQQFQITASSIFPFRLSFFLGDVRFPFSSAKPFWIWHYFLWQPFWNGTHQPLSRFQMCPQLKIVQDRCIRQRNIRFPSRKSAWSTFWLYSLLLRCLKQNWWSFIRIILLFKLTLFHLYFTCQLIRGYLLDITQEVTYFLPHHLVGQKFYLNQ